LCLFLFLLDKPEIRVWGILSSIVSYIFVIFFYIKIEKIDLNFKYLLPSKRIILYIIFLSILFVLAYPFLTIINFASNLFDNVVNLTTINNTNLFSETSSIFYFISIVFITPILEEIYFRGIILSQLNKIYNVFWSILISSLLFSIYHMDYEQSQISLFFGLLSGYLYAKTNNLFISVLLHSLINFFIFFTMNHSVNLLDHSFLLLFIPLIIILMVVFTKKIIKK